MYPNDPNSDLALAYLPSSYNTLFGRSLLMTKGAQSKTESFAFMQQFGSSQSAVSDYRLLSPYYETLMNNTVWKTEPWKVKQAEVIVS